MKKALSQLKALATKPEWLADQGHKDLLRSTLSLAREKFYRFEPYYNRSDGTPSWQWKFLMAAGQAKGRVALGANRIGKSEMGAYEAALAITGQHPTRTFPETGIGWIIGLDNAMLRDIDRPLFDGLLPSRFKTKYYKQDQIWVCHGDDREWQLVFKSTEMGTDKFQGAKIDFAWIDEEPKNTDVFPEIEARLVDNNGIWWMTATPVKGTAWLKELSERQDVFRTFAGMLENPYLPLDAVTAYADTLGEDERAVRVDGQYIIFGGRPVFARKLLQAFWEAADSVEVEQGTLCRV